MSQEFPKAYQPNQAENKWYQKWIDNKVFAADNNSDK